MSTMPTCSEEVVRRALGALAHAHGLDWDTFVALGEADELLHISPDVDFGFRVLMTSLRKSTPTGDLAPTLAEAVASGVTQLRWLPIMVDKSPQSATMVMHLQ
jgi:hypothetical protein